MDFITSVYSLSVNLLQRSRQAAESNQLTEFLSTTFLNNDLIKWSIAILIAAIILTILLVLRRVVKRLALRMASTDEIELMELPMITLSKTSALFVTFVSIMAGIQILDLPARITQVLISAFTIVAVWQCGRWLMKAVSVWLDRKRDQAFVEDRAASGSFSILNFAARVLIWSLALLLILDNLGVDITALVTGLGIGGIAIALAVQNILGDLLASLSITLDKPFVVGDFLILGDFLGSVEYIGIKTTRIRSLSGEQIVMSNNDLLGSRIRNYGRMAERRVPFTLGVTYETPREKLKKIPEVLRKLVEEQTDTRFDRSHFSKYGAFSLDFETVYYVLSADYNQFMDVQQAIFLRIHEEFEKLGIEFAYPTQKLWLEKVEENPS